MKKILTYIHKNFYKDGWADAANKKFGEQFVVDAVTFAVKNGFFDAHLVKITTRQIDGTQSFVFFSYPFTLKGEEYVKSKWYEKFMFWRL